jgi:hypothetical protein
VAQKKAVSVPLETRRGWIHPEPSALSIAQQGAVAGLARSTYYYESVPEWPENLALMRLIDELYLERPFYGVPRMTDWLKTLGHAVNHKRVARLMRVMGVQAVLPGPHTCLPAGRPAGLHRRSRGMAGLGPVLCVLQHRTTAPEPGLADAGRGTLRVRRGGATRVWTGGRSPRITDPGAKF